MKTYLRKQLVPKFSPLLAHQQWSQVQTNIHSQDPTDHSWPPGSLSSVERQRQNAGILASGMPPSWRVHTDHQGTFLEPYVTAHCKGDSVGKCRNHPGSGIFHTPQELVVPCNSQ